MAQLSQTATQVSGRAQAGLDMLERKALEVGQFAEHKLGDQGIAPRQLGETIVSNIGAARHELAKNTRRSRKKLAKNAKRTRKQLARAAKDATLQARHAARVARQTGQKTAGEIAAGIDQHATRAGKEAAKAARRTRRDVTGRGLRRRRWPWVLLGLAAAAAAAAAALAWTGSAPPAGLAEEPAPGSPPETDTSGQTGPPAPHSSPTGQPE
jgi:hypothetical protein